MRSPGQAASSAARPDSVTRSATTPCTAASVSVRRRSTAIASRAESRPFNQTVIDIFLRVILVVGLYIFIGNSGVMSFGHTGFTCLGGYAAAWLTMPPMMKQTLLPGLPNWLMQLQLPFWAGAVFAALWAALWAALFGRVLMRLSGIAASIATFAMLAMINTIYSNWESVTAATSSSDSIC